jgi:hypothetical protein
MKKYTPEQIVSKLRQADRELDSMSAGLHGNPETAARDREIRMWLRNQGYQVDEITVVELDDRDAMIRHFRKLARHLQGRDRARTVADDSSWFDRASATERPDQASPPPPPPSTSSKDKE